MRNEMPELPLAIATAHSFARASGSQEGRLVNVPDWLHDRLTLWDGELQIGAMIALSKSIDTCTPHGRYDQDITKTRNKLT